MMLITANGWSTWLGHFHPVIVHLPIGILIVAFILELVAWKRTQDTSLDHAIEISLIAGSLSALIACLFGWFLSREGGYNESTLFMHQWMGIAVAVLAGVCWIIKRKQGTLLKAKSFYRFLLVCMIVLLTATGHFGGNMTHGEDYLTAGMPQPFARWFGTTTKKDTLPPRKPITNINDAIVYADLVVPVLQEKCYNCHSAKKVKGSLRMDQEALLFKGGKHGAIIEPGKPEASELIKRLLLPVEDDKRMPPKDQPAITKEETALLQWWIKAGADTKKTVSQSGADAATLTMLASFIQAPAKDTQQQKPLSKVYEQDPGAINQADVEALVKTGLLVAPIAKGRNLLEVSCINRPAFNDKDMPLLMKLAPNIVWLKLDNTAITDEALTQVAQMKNLVQLSVAGTNITTAGMVKLQHLSYLEYINIVQTKVDDGVLAACKAMPSLQHIYCWNALITPKAIASFKQQSPTIHIEAGSNNP